MAGAPVTRTGPDGGMTHVAGPIRSGCCTPCSNAPGCALLSGPAKPSQRTRTRSGSAVVVAGHLISAGAVSPIVIRAGHRAQVVVCGQHEMSRFVDGQLWMVLHQARGHLTTRGALIPEFPAHVVAVFQDRRIRSGDPRR